MSRDYLDFDLAVTREGQGYAARVVGSPAGQVSAPFTLPFSAVELAQFMVAVGPPRVSSRRLVPAAARVVDVKEYGRRLGDALLSGEVARAFRDSLTTATGQGKDLRLRLRLDAVPDLDPVPWEYLYDTRLDRFLTLSQETPIVRLIDSAERPPVVDVKPPMRVLVMISSPSDMPELAVEREEQLLRGTTGDLVKSGQLELVVLQDATLTSLQRALLDDYHVFHFIGHGGFDQQAQEGVLVLERPDGTAHRVSGARLGTLLHDARDLQLAVLNACEGARTSGRDAFSGVGQALVRQGLPAVVAMQTEISDRAALVFSHEFYWFLTHGLGIDGAICEVRKAMAVSDEASEWGTAVLLRSGADQPFNVLASAASPATRTDGRLESLYDAAQGALAAQAPATALPMLEQIAAERPDYQDVTELIERVRPTVEAETAPPAVPEVGLHHPSPTPPLPPDEPAGIRPAGGPDALASTQVLPTQQPRDRFDEPRDEPRVEPRTEPRAEPRAEPQTQRRDEAQMPPPGQQPYETVEPERRRRRGRGPVGSIIGLVVLIAIAWFGATQVPKWLKEATANVDQACGPPAATRTARHTDFVAGCATSAPAIDGSFSDWDSVPTMPVHNVVAQIGQPQPEFGGEWQVLWDKSALYVRAHVIDPDIRSVNLDQPGAYFRGDGFSFEFGPDASKLPATDRTRRGRDVDVMVGLARELPTSAAASINPAGNGTFTTGTGHPEIIVARADTITGYDLEARIPWSSLQLREPPARESVYSMNFNLSDAVSSPKPWALRTMKSTNPDRTSDTQPFPRNWQTILFADAATGG